MWRAYERLVKLFVQGSGAHLQLPLTPRTGRLSAAYLPRN